jgi:hypothetical protein
MSRRAARVDDALGNALVVEVEDLLAKDEVLKQHGSALAALQLVLIVGNANALIGRQVGFSVVRSLLGYVLVGFAAIADVGRVFARHVRHS